MKKCECHEIGTPAFWISLNKSLYVYWKISEFLCRSKGSLSYNKSSFEAALDSNED